MHLCRFPADATISEIPKFEAFGGQQVRVARNCYHPDDTRLINTVGSLASW